MGGNFFETAFQKEETFQNGLLVAKSSHMLLQKVPTFRGKAKVSKISFRGLSTLPGVSGGRKRPGLPAGSIIDEFRKFGVGPAPSQIARGERLFFRFWLLEV